MLATGLVLGALLLTAIWLIPPWWTPYCYLGLWLTTVLFRSPEAMRSSALAPRSGGGRVVLVVLFFVSAGATSAILLALGGRSPPSGQPIVDLSFPMGSGRYLIANGGASAVVNGHFATLQPKTDRQRAYRGQSYAVDIIKLGPWGLRTRGWRPTDPAAYAIFGELVRAPCSGSVLSAVDGKPDMPVPVVDTSLLEGNHVLIHCEEFAVLLAHLQRGSLTVLIEDKVESGQPVGRAGNSGQTNEPHLHIHVQSLAASRSLLSGDPYFLSFDGRFPVRNERITIDTPQPDAP